jgi:hypothetical protein
VPVWPCRLVQSLLVLWSWDRPLSYCVVRPPMGFQYVASLCLRNVDKYLYADPDFDPVENDLDVVLDNLYAYTLARHRVCDMPFNRTCQLYWCLACPYCSTNCRAIGLGTPNPLPMQAPIEAQMKNKLLKSYFSYTCHDRSSKRNRHDGAGIEAQDSTSRAVRTQTLYIK